MTSEELQLPQRTIIETAQEALDLATSLEGETGLLIDASEVEAMDGPTVIALANIARTLSNRGAKVSVEKPTPAFIDSFADLGLFEDLMKMEFRK